jgi:hypothetical protein
MSGFAKLLLVTGFLTAPFLAAPAQADGHRSHHQSRQSFGNVQSCREFTQKVTIGGRTQYAYGTACQTRDGDWSIVDNTRAKAIKKHYKRHHGHEPRWERREARRSGPDGIVWHTDNRHPYHRGW